MRKDHWVHLTSALAVCAAASIMPAHAATPSGYAGLAIGWNDTQMEADSTANVAGNAIRETTEDGLTGPAFGALLGLKLPISTGYVGVEANVTDSSSETEGQATLNGNVDFAYAITSDLSYGLNIQLGTDVNATTRLYGLVGVQQTEFGVKQEGIASFDDDETLTGVRFGFGLETDVTDMLAIRFQWTQTQYEDFTLSDSDPVANLSESIEYEPTENLFSVALTGKF